MAAELLRSGLPYSWTYGVTTDGRIFFIDDENRRTTWLHPRDREPAQTGYRPLRDLPQGWEQGVTPEGALYYIDHNTHSTTFVHPITKETVGADVNIGSNEAPSLQRPADKSIPHSPQSPYHPEESLSPSSPMDSRQNTLKKSPSGKTRIVDRHPSVKGDRNNKAEITMRGWLLKQDHTGPLKNWKQRWCVLADFCLFFYKDNTETQATGSILLPSYKVNTCDKDDGINKKFAFKVEHENMQTYFFAAETRDDMQKWLNALSLATILQRDPSVDQGPPRLPNGPTADKFINHPAKQVDENDNSVISGNDLDDYGFNERYPQRRTMQELPTRSDGYPDRGRGDPNGGYGRDNGDFDARGDDYRYNAGYDDRGRYDPEGQGRSYQGGPNMRDSYSERVPYRRQDDVSNGRGRDSFSDRGDFRQGSELGSKGHGEPSYGGSRLGGSQLSGPSHDSYGNRPAEIANRTFEPIASTSQPKGYGSLNRSPQRPEQNPHYDIKRPGDRDSYMDYRDPRRPDSEVVPHREPQVPKFKQGFDDREYDDRDGGSNGRDRGYESRPQYSDRGQGTMGQTLKVPSMQLRINDHGDHQRQSLVGDGDGSDSVFTDRSDQKKIVPTKAEAVQSLQKWHQNETGRHDLAPRRPDSQAQSYDGARNDIDGQYRPDSNIGAYNPPNLSHESREPNLGPGYDQRGNREINGRKPQNPSNQNAVQTSPKRHHDLSLDARSDHIYENISPYEGGSHNASYESGSMPNRPPLPVVYRDQIIRELAQTQTPHTQQDFMDAAENESKRYNQPTYFQFPESPPSGQKDAPDSYYEAKQRVENLEGRPYEPDDASIQGQRQNTGRNDIADKRSSQSSQRSADYPHPQRSNDNPQGFTNPPSFTNEGGRYDSLGRAAKPQFRPSGEPIHTIKEDPNMADTDVFETKYRSLRKTYSVTPLNGHKLRLSIQPADLEGKSHEELVLLLIQLRREQSKLERNRDTYRKLVEQRREQERNYKSLRKSGARPDDVMEDEHEQYQQIKLRLENLENHVEVHRPLVNLVDNMVKMGSLYTGSTDMLFSQYKKHLLSPDEVTPPKRMLEFSRQLQEDKLVNDHKEDLKNLKQEDIDYEEKMVQLHQLDRELQELSIMVTSLQDDKKMLDQAMREVERDQDRYKDDPREMERLTQEHRVLERQLSNCVHQLAEHSRVLEEVTAENSKVEMEVTMLRSKVHDISKSSSMPTLTSESYRTKVKLENELNKVQGIMDGLLKQGQQLSDAMNTLRKSNPDLTAVGSDRPGTYLETDLDNMKSRDIALRTPTPTSSIRRSYSERDSYSARGSRDDLRRNDTEDQDMTDADDNTKRYYGFLPKDRKATTVRDVKRESERRSRGRDPSPRFSGSPLNRSQSLPRHLDGRVEQEPIQQQQMSANYSSPPTAAFDRNGPGSTHTLPTRGSQGPGNMSSLPLSSPFARNMPGSTSTLPTRGSQNPSDPDVLRQAAVALSRQQSLTRLPQPMQRKQMSASYDALDQQISPKIQKPMSSSHEILNRPEIPERRYEPIRTVSTSDLPPRASQGNTDLAQHRSPDAPRQPYPDVTRQQYSKQTDPYPDVAKQQGYRDVARQPGYQDVARQPGYPDVSRQPENVPHVPPRYPDADRPSGYHVDSQPKPGHPKDTRQPIKSKPWEPKLSANSASLTYSPPEVTRNGRPYDPASEPIAQQHPVGYGSLDRKSNGYGSLDRHPQKQVPGSPETEIKQPFYPIKPEQVSYQQLARPLEPPRGQYEDSVSPDRYREPVQPSNRYQEPRRPGYPDSNSKQYPEVVNRSPSPKGFQKYPTSYEHSPHGSRTDSPRAYPLGAPRDQQADRKEYRQPQEGKPKEYRQPQFGSGQKPDSLIQHQPGSYQYERHQPRNQVERPYHHEERRHSQDSPSTNHQRQIPVDNTSSSGREPVPDSPQLRRSATLPVGRASNKKNEWSPTVTDRLYPRNRDSATSQSPRSSAHGTPQRTHSPLNQGQQSSPRSTAQNSRPSQAHPPYSRSDEPIQKQTSLPYSRSEEPIQQKQPKLPYSQSEEPIRPSKIGLNMRVPDEPKRDTRGRFQTIASSVPAQMEYSVEENEPEQNGKSDDDDMDDPEMYRRAKKTSRQYSFDDSTIDRLVLFSPDKVDIPERYIPDDEEELTPEERERREKKVERIRKLLSAQSLQDWTKVGVEDNTRSLHDTVSEEKKRREMVLEMREKLARQVTLRSKQVAAEANKKQRRKTWSGGNARSWEDVVG